MNLPEVHVDGLFAGGIFDFFAMLGLRTDYFNCFDYTVVMGLSEKLVDWHWFPVVGRLVTNILRISWICCLPNENFASSIFKLI